MKTCSKRGCNNSHNTKYKMCAECRADNRVEKRIHRNSRLHKIEEVCMMHRDTKVAEEILKIIRN